MNYSNIYIKYGIIGGLFMALIMTFLGVSGDFEIGPVKYLKYIPLFAVLVIAGNYLKNNVSRNDFFSNASKTGIKISALCGAIAGVTVIILYFINPEYAPLKFNVSPETFGKTFIIAFMLFVETFVFGIIFNFIVIQGLKPGAETVQQ